MGLDSSELGFPPSLFQEVFQLAAKEGFKLVAHAGMKLPVDTIILLDISQEWADQT